MENSKLNENKINSIFDFNIQRKINCNKSFNKSTNENLNNKKGSNLNKPNIKIVSKFNPYDIGFLKTNKKEKIYKTGIKEHKSNNCIYIFNTPKINLNLGNYNNYNKETPEYLIKIKKQKNQYFTELKNASNNRKIKSTNYSSNNESYNNNEINHYYYENEKKNETKLKDSFDKNINEINIRKNIEKTQIIPEFIKSLEKYLKLASIPKQKSKSKHKKNKIKVNKSANNIKITNKKYFSTNDYKSETTKIKNKLPEESKIIENIGITKNKSFINKLLTGFCCCNKLDD